MLPRRILDISDVQIEDDGVDTLNDEGKQIIVYLLVEAMDIPKEQQSPAKKQIQDLELKLLFNLDLRLTTATPMFFMHHILERAVVARTLRQEEACAVGACAVGISWMLMKNEEIICEYMPSEVAGAAVYCSAVNVYGEGTC